MDSYPSNLQHIEKQRRRLEQQWQPTPSQKLRQASGEWLQAAGQWLLQSLTEGNKIQIWTKTTKIGTQWHVHEPIDGIHCQFDSEEAVRTWLEQRHNH